MTTFSMVRDFSAHVAAYSPSGEREKPIMMCSVDESDVPQDGLAVREVSHFLRYHIKWWVTDCDSILLLPKMRSIDVMSGDRGDVTPKDVSSDVINKAVLLTSLSAIKPCGAHCNIMFNSVPHDAMPTEVSPPISTPAEVCRRYLSLTFAAGAGGSLGRSRDVRHSEDLDCDVMLNGSDTRRSEVEDCDAMPNDTGPSTTTPSPSISADIRDVFYHVLSSARGDCCKVDCGTYDLSRGTTFSPSTSANNVMSQPYVSLFSNMHILTQSYDNLKITFNSSQLALSGLTTTYRDRASSWCDDNAISRRPAVSGSLLSALNVMYELGSYVGKVVKYVIDLSVMSADLTTVSAELEFIMLELLLPSTTYSTLVMERKVTSQSVMSYSKFLCYLLVR